MTHWSVIRKRAREEYLRGVDSFSGEISLEKILEAAIKATGLDCIGLPKGHELLAGGEARLDIESNAIWYRNDVELWKQTFYKAHELAHFWLHQYSFICSNEDLNPEATEEDILERVDSYSPRERMEREANVCAREFLMPSFWIREQFIKENKGLSDLVRETGLPDGMVQHQMSRALLMVEEEEVKTESKRHSLDDSQKEAAFIPKGPVLVEAGPGTGKTSTLIGRLEKMLTKGMGSQDENLVPVSPNNILALTFSNKAAEEMRERLSRVCPKEAQEVWMGTFHAFGMELLLKYGPWPEAGIVNSVRGLSILEELLPELDLNHFLNLAKPVAPLKDIQDAISRAKDELCSPSHFKQLALEMYKDALQQLDDVSDEKQRKEVEERLLNAEKSLEAAGIYEKYQAYLEEHKLYDFGDLIYKSAELLQEDASILKDVQNTYKHVLVDEIQDINHASGVFLELIAGDGEGLWMVGDVRQAIYRFRGASTASILRFNGDSRVEKRSLKWNYRSQQPIINVFALLATKMRASSGFDNFSDWKAQRAADGGQVRMEIAENPAAEGLGIAELIKNQNELFQQTKGAEGLRYRDQAILCRTNNQLAQMAQMLAQADIPTLFLGNFFERPEIADMLSMLELLCEPGGRGIYRVAQFPEYNISLNDLQELQKLAREQKVRFPQAISLANDADNISEAGREKFNLLWRHIQDFHPGTSSWQCLSQYLFENSRYLRDLLLDNSIAGQQMRISLFQLLEFSYGRSREQVESKKGKVRDFLQHIRLMIIRNDDRGLWQAPGWAAGIDAVRMLTVHASKGLEFKAVYIPMLGKGLFPFKRLHDFKPMPDGLLSIDPKEDHSEEEECLFFVACSRARDFLCLSKAAMGYQSRNGKPTRSNPPEILVNISEVLPRRPDDNVTWKGVNGNEEKVEEVPIPNELPEYVARQLDDYLFCPRKYSYEHELSIGGATEVTPYFQLHRCVRKVMRVMLEDRQSGEEIRKEETLQFLDEVWKAKGLNDVPHAERYWEEAKRLVTNVVHMFSDTPVSEEMLEWRVERSHAFIRIAPDHVARSTDSAEPITTIQKWKTGRIGSKEKDKPYYALLAEGARAALPGETIEVEVHSLADGESETMPVKPTLLSKYDKAIQGIQSGQFPAKNDSRECPYCPYFFICPVG